MNLLAIYSTLGTTNTMSTDMLITTDDDELTIITLCHSQQPAQELHLHLRSQLEL